jgi:hypothetical protein
MLEMEPLEVGLIAGALLAALWLLNLLPSKPRYATAPKPWGILYARRLLCPRRRSSVADLNALPRVTFVCAATSTVSCGTVIRPASRQASPSQRWSSTPTRTTLTP